MSLNLPPELKTVFDGIYGRLSNLERRRLPDFASLSTRPVPDVSQHGIFGDASDGVIDFDGTTTRLGLVPSSGIYTMTRDLYLADLSKVSGTAQLRDAGYRIFCAGEFTIEAGAKVQCNGLAPVGNLAGVAGPGGLFGGGTNGGAGGSFSNAPGGVAANPASQSLGGTGGSCGTPNNGATQPTGAASPPTAIQGGFPRNMLQGVQMTTVGSSNTYQGGTGGRAGGGSTGAGAAGSGGGAGGGGGGNVCIIALILTNLGAIEAKGGAGANATNTLGGGTTGAGGGGGGGGGGVVVVCGEGSTTGTVVVTGGALGLGIMGTGAAGSNGTAGSDGHSFLLLV